MDRITTESNTYEMVEEKRPYWVKVVFEDGTRLTDLTIRDAILAARDKAVQLMRNVHMSYVQIVEGLNIDRDEELLFCDARAYEGLMISAWNCELYRQGLRFRVVDEKIHDKIPDSRPKIIRWLKPYPDFGCFEIILSKNLEW